VANVAKEARDVIAGADLAKCELVSCVTDQNVAENQSTDSSDKCSKIPEHLKTLYRNSVKDLTTEYQKTKVYNLLCDNADLFSKGSNDIGRTDLVKHKINTGNAKPIKQAPRRLPFAKREAADQAVAEMQEHDVIEPSTSPWSSPVVLVQKKDGSLRFCVDYRKLNNVTLKDSYPLPRIDDTLDALGGSQWVSTLDLKSGVKYLGHVVSHEGIAADPTKIQVIKSWPRPRCLSELRSFLGLCSYYRKFIADYAHISHPLQRLTEKNAPFHWDSAAETSYQALKLALVTPPVLAFPTEDGIFVLDTDVSGKAIGAVLSQNQGNGEKVIAYFSRSLDRISFKFPEGQLARWLQKIQQYDFHVEHRPGKEHLNADALSRRPCLRNSCRNCDRMESKEQVSNEKERCPTHEETLEQINVVRRCSEGTPENDLDYENILESASLQDIAEAQRKDADIGPVIKWMREDSRPGWSVVSPRSKVTKTYWAQWDSLCLKNNVLYRKWESSDGTDIRLQLVVPNSLKQPILTQLHNHVTAGHFGVTKTVERIRQKFYWVNCRSDVQLWCGRCSLCSSRKGPTPQRKAPLGKYLVGTPMERIAVDVMGPLPLSEGGNRYILVAMVILLHEMG
ncbi:Hypothetical predicted protein, partial [Paramuricea clavata]